MEATKEGMGLLDEILPPRLEDAGLEECALPPDSIQEAFRKAADAVKSRAASFFHDEEGGCVADPWPDAKEMETDVVVGAGMPPSPGASDTIVGGGAKPVATGSCIGGELGEEGEGGDAVVVGGGEGGRGCGGDGLKGLGVEGMNEKKDVKEEEEEGEKPILVEGFV